MQILLAALLALTILSCSPKKGNDIKGNTSLIKKPIDTLNFKKYFDADSAVGCFALYDMKNKKFYYHDSSRCYAGFLPASTFKIPNSLFFLEAGVIKDENEKIKWDGVKRWRDEWNQDTDLRMAFKYSTVWFYQECARRMGLAQMKNFVDTLNYGNKDISAGVDAFWLKGKMRISAMEQIALVKNIYDNKVPFKQRNIDILKDIMILEKGDNYTLRGKTGTAVNDDSKVGWLVGYLTTEDNIYFFALNLDINEGNWKFEERFSIMKNVFEAMEVVKFKTN